MPAPIPGARSRAIHRVLSWSEGKARLGDREPLTDTVSPTMMTKHAMGNLAPDPPAKPTDDRAHKPAAPVGRKNRDRASDKAHNDEGPHEFTPSARGKVKSPARAHKVRSSSTE